MVTKKTVLITGGFGFLGGRLGWHLTNNYNVILGSRFEKIAPDWLPLSKTIKIDWESERSLLNSCESVDIIIHASGLNKQECHNDPEKDLLVNGTYTKNLVKAAISQNVKKIIYLSTIHVYSDNLTGVVTEYAPIKNTHPYASSNVAGEDAVLLAIDKGFIRGAVVRAANIFGRPMDKTMNCWMLLVNDLCRQAIVEGRLTLYGDSEAVGDFVTIDDFCSAIGFLIKIEDTNTIINIGSGKICTVGDMANRVQKNCMSALGFEPSIVLKNKPKDKKNLFHYQTNYMNSVNFKFNNEFDLEIKELLYFCKDNFYVK